MNTQTKEQLISEKNALLAKLNGKNHDEIFALLKTNETALKDIARAELLKQVNSKETRLRELARQAYECEQPTEDITCTDGSFHKTKIKKYPKISALQYASATWENNRITRLTINGERFNMFQAKYEYGKETTYTRPETFADFLKLNTIAPADITIEQYNEICDKLNGLNEQLKKDIEKYKRGLESLNYSSLNYWGLIGQHNVNLYEYIPNK
jgi:hypothetical protein